MTNPTGHLIPRAEQVNLSLLKAILLLCILCFAVRLAFCLVVVPVIQNHYYGGDNWDPDGYAKIARNILRGHFTPEPSHTAYLRRGPGYPAAIAMAFVLLGEGLFSVQVLNCVLATLAVPAILSLATHIGGLKQVGIIASLAYVFWVPSVWYTGRANYETLSATLIVWTTALLYSAVVEKKRVLSFVGGVLIGVQALTNQVYLYIMPGTMLVMAVLTHFGKRLSAKAWLNINVVAGIFLVVLPWTMRNYAVSQGFVVVHTGAAEVHLMGRFVTDAILQGDFSDRSAAKNKVFQMLYSEALVRGHVLNDLEADRYFTRIALDLIKENPAYLLIQMAVTGVGFWFFGESVEKTLVMVILNGALITSAVMGLMSLWRRGFATRAALPLAVIALTNVAYSVALAESRYSVVVVPLLLILAACVRLNGVRHTGLLYRPSSAGASR